MPAGWTALPTNAGGPVVAYQVDPPAEPISAAWIGTTSAGSGHAIATFNPE
ncbi:hypothetical protein GCM10029963_53080 [Micromonospora andamanensis]|uniref:hypothetical protein n=1 Tax=Micromonospora andamanensis TaxID=1287068 RepID=UPI003644EC41